MKNTQLDDDIITTEEVWVEVCGLQEDLENLKTQNSLLIKTCSIILMAILHTKDEVLFKEICSDILNVEDITHTLVSLISHKKK